MPRRLDGINLTSESGWVKFDQSWIEKSIHRIIYKFKCSLKPIFAYSKGDLYSIKLDDKYLLKNFEIISSKEGNLEMLYLGNDQHHPHKDPRNDCLCLGKFIGQEVTTKIVPLLICCLLTINVDDCFSVPDSCCILENKNGG